VLRILSIVVKNLFLLKRQFFLGFDTHLFVKVLRPGVSKGTFSVFESNCHMSLPV